MTERGVLDVSEDAAGRRLFRPADPISPRTLSEALAALGAAPATSAVAHSVASDAADTIIDRGTLAELLYLAAGRPRTAAGTSSPFHDVSVSHPAFTAISWLREVGITSGWDDGYILPSFRPETPATRDAVAAFLARWEPIALQRED
ncbi:S-layer homology domain-containing protein [Microbacterium pullorum]|nr:S-layer homology domain-containing protein [Microbacterium pullorum]